MFDTHAHVNFRDFKDDAKQTMQRAHDKNVSVVLVGSQFSTSERAVKMAQEYENTYSAVGLHPFHLVEREVQERVDDKEIVKIKSRAEKFVYADYLSLAKSNKKVVAIGECGFDYHFTLPENLAEERKVQEQAFNEQINLANELHLPMIIHCRDGFDDLLATVKNNPIKSGAVMHFYSGNWQQAQPFVELGYYFGFTGAITFKKKVETIVEVACNLELDKMLSETDCPYVAPEPYRGQRNEPVYVELVARKLADIRGLSFAEMVGILDENAKRFFKL